MSYAKSMLNRWVSHVSLDPVKLVKHIVFIEFFIVGFTCFTLTRVKPEKKMNDFNRFRSFTFPTPKGVFSGCETRRKKPLGRGKKFPPRTMTDKFASRLTPANHRSNF